MTSKIKVDNINKVSDDSNIIKKCGTTITLGASGDSIALASGALPVLTEIYPPAVMIRSNDCLFTMRSLIILKEFALNGSMTIVSPSLKLLICNWHDVTWLTGPCGLPLITTPHVPHIPSRQSWSNAIGSCPFSISSLLSLSSISKKDISDRILSIL